jgi:hypothetical protein
VAVLLSLLLVGCQPPTTSTGRSSTTSTPTSATSTSSTTTSLATSTTATATANPGETFEMEVLRKVRLVDGDLPFGYTFRLIERGDEAQGQVTLDICSGDFPSEAARTGRLQQVALRRGEETLISNETVTYRSPEDAAAALQEVRAAVGRCPKNRFVPSKVEGVAPLKFDVRVIADPLLGTVTSDHVGVEGTATDEAGRTYPQVQVYQRRGSVLIGVYGSDLTTVRPFLAVVAKRLESLNPGEAGE